VVSNGTLYGSGPVRDGDALLSIGQCWEDGLLQRHSLQVVLDDKVGVNQVGGAPRVDEGVGKGSVHTRAVEQGNVETQGEGAAFVAEYGVVDAGGFEGVELRRRGRLRFGHFDKGWADVGAGYGNAHVRCLRGVTQLRGGALFFLRQVAVLSCGLA
jgi:hypothetical protein